MRTVHEVRSIRLDGKVITFAQGRLEVTEDAPADFILEFETPAGHNLPSGAIEIEVADGRTYRGNGIDADPNPWSHRYINGLGMPSWVDAE